MSTEDDYLEDDEAEGGQGPSPDKPSSVPQPVDRSFRNWLQGKRGWVAIVVLALLQGIFALILITLRTNAKSAAVTEAQKLKDLTVAMLGHEVAIKQINQVIPAPGGKRMTIGLDVVLVLGQLPEERVEGAPTPTDAEFELFMSAIRNLEPRIRSRINSFLQRTPVGEYERADVQSALKEDLKGYINDSLDALDFGSGVRKEIGKRRVTDVLLPLFVRQVM